MRSAAWLHGRIMNANDYPVKLSSIRLGTVPPGSRAKPDFMGIFSVGRIDVLPVVPPHDSVRFHWDAEKLDSLLGFNPACQVAAATVGECVR